MTDNLATDQVVLAKLDQMDRHLEVMWRGMLKLRVNGTGEISAHRQHILAAIEALQSRASDFRTSCTAASAGR